MWKFLEVKSAHKFVNKWQPKKKMMNVTIEMPEDFWKHYCSEKFGVDQDGKELVQVNNTQMSQM